MSVPQFFLKKTRMARRFLCASLRTRRRKAGEELEYGNCQGPSPETTAKAPWEEAGPKRKVVFQPSNFRCKLLVSGRVDGAKVSPFLVYDGKPSQNELEYLGSCAPSSFILIIWVVIGEQSEHLVGLKYMKVTNVSRSMRHASPRRSMLA